MIPGTEVIIPETIKNFEMQIRYRILPRCFGYYEILDKTVYAAEIEKICTSTNTLSFDDYLQCRKLHFIIHLFYNDGFFSTLVKFIKSLNFSADDMVLDVATGTGDVAFEIREKYFSKIIGECWTPEAEKILIY